MIESSERFYASLKQSFSSLILVLLFSLFILLPSLDNEWVNWDDQEYVLENVLIHNLSFEHISDLFKSSEVQGNYHPITLLSLALDYRVSGKEALFYHFHNLLLHLLNTALVYIFIFRLSQKNRIATISSLLFAIHPMHIESIAWISARKDVLYSFYFLLSLIIYLKYLSLKDRKALWYILTLVSFSLSILAKAMAVILPLILLLIDYLAGRKDLKKMLIEKLPFFILSGIFGYLAILAQEEAGAVANPGSISFINSISTAAYSLLMYAGKALIPLHLSAFHPYPVELGTSLPFFYYLTTPFLLLILFFFRKALIQNKMLGFGIGFFVISLIPVLQFLPVGNAMHAERYTYIAYIGLFLCMAERIDSYLFSKKEIANYKHIYFAIIGVILLIFGISSRNRIEVWENGEKLWSDVIKKYPDDYFAYGCRANYWIDQGKYEQALQDLDACLSKNPNFAEAYVNRGLLYASIEHYEEALKDYDMAIKLDPNNYLPYLNRGSLLRLLKQPQFAIDDLSYAISLHPNLSQAFHNRGIAYKQTRRYDLALKDFEQASNLDSKNPFIWYSRGILLYEQQEFHLAERDFIQVLRLKPDYSEAYFYLGKCQYAQGSIALAKQNIDQARKLNFPVEEALINELTDKIPRVDR
ncbi:MAG: tetratricopeptide repeat protein [Bacteroidota bacterium]